MGAQAGKEVELYCSHHTTCSRRVVMALLESGVDFSYHHVDMKKGEHKSPEFLKLQPFGKVPALKEGDFTLFESRAIMRYAASKGGSLVPASVQDRAVVDQVISIEYSYFSPAFMPVYFERMLKPAKNLGATDETKVAAAIAQLEPVLDTLETLLEGKDYFAAGHFTLADLTFMCYFQCFDKCGISSLLAQRPNLAKWWSLVSVRPHWVYAVAGKVVEKAP